MYLIRACERGRAQGRVCVCVVDGGRSGLSAASERVISGLARLRCLFATPPPAPARVGPGPCLRLRPWFGCSRRRATGGECGVKTDKRAAFRQQVSSTPARSGSAACSAAARCSDAAVLGAGRAGCWPAHYETNHGMVRFMTSLCKRRSEAPLPPRSGSSLRGLLPRGALLPRFWALRARVLASAGPRPCCRRGTSRTVE